MDNKYIEIIKGTSLFESMSDEEITQFLRPDGSSIKAFARTAIFSRRRQDRLFWHTSGGQGAYRT